MFKPHKNICSSCKKETIIVVKRGLCAKCNYEHKQANKKESGKSTAKYVYIPKNSGQADVFTEIWIERDHKCQVCSEPIIYPIASNFSHLLPKGLNKYPLFRLYKKNILIMCHFSGRPDGKPGCHFLLDHTPRSELKKDSKWNWVFELEAELKEEYKNYKIVLNKQK